MDINIQEIVNELLGSGMTQQEIADAIKCSQPTISDIANGKVGQSRPSFAIVDGLQKLRDTRSASHELEK